MAQIENLFQHADWKMEKHVPVIECPDAVAADEMFDFKVSLGKEVAHPNTTEHHIRWIQVYFHGTGDKFPYEVGKFDFTAHGESVNGANQGPVYTHHAVAAGMKIKKAGTLVATAYCNIHGLWESTKEISMK
ncbi:MAG: Neelaredoxin [Desulfobacteraceae bacterium]|nr:MAG: Neelaredoxin [Desulfobacteraceae bacterium]